MDESSGRLPTGTGYFTVGPNRDMLFKVEDVNRVETLTDYVEGILEKEVARPPAREVFERIAARSPIKLDRPAADLIRAERQSRNGS